MGPIAATAPVFPPARGRVNLGSMPIIDEELFVECRRCGWEAATGIRRTERGLREDPPGERRVVCHRCGASAVYGDGDWYHRTVERDRELVDA